MPFCARYHSNTNFVSCTFLVLSIIHVCVCISADVRESMRVGYCNAVTLVWGKKLVWNAVTGGCRYGSYGSRRFLYLIFVEYND